MPDGTVAVVAGHLGTQLCSIQSGGEPYLFQRELSTGPLLDLLREGNNGTAEFARRTMHREAEIPFPSLQRALSAADVF